MGFERRRVHPQGSPPLLTAGELLPPHLRHVTSERRLGLIYVNCPRGSGESGVSGSCLPQDTQSYQLLPRLCPSCPGAPSASRRRAAEMLDRPASATGGSGPVLGAGNHRPVRVTVGSPSTRQGPRGQAGRLPLPFCSSGRLSGRGSHRKGLRPAGSTTRGARCPKSPGRLEPGSAWTHRGAGLRP